MGTLKLDRVICDLDDWTAADRQALSTELLGRLGYENGINPNDIVIMRASSTYIGSIEEAKRQRDNYKNQRDTANAVFDNIIPADMRHDAPEGYTKVALILMIGTSCIVEGNFSKAFNPYTISGLWPGDMLNTFQDLVSQMPAIFGVAGADLRGNIETMCIRTQEDRDLLFSLLYAIPGEGATAYKTRRHRVINILCQHVEPEFSKTGTRSNFTDGIGKFIDRTHATREKRILRRKKQLVT